MTRGPSVDRRPAALTGPLRGLLRSAVTVTVLSVLAQVLAFGTQIVIAALFGAGFEMDAYLAATTIPQYVASVLLSGLGFAFVPTFVQASSTGRSDEAWATASGVINLCLLSLAGLALAGCLSAPWLIAWTTPGLAAGTQGLAARLSIIVWPTIVLTSAASLLSGIYQARGRFGWPAAVPVLGAAVTLGLVTGLSPAAGIFGLAWAVSGGLAVQAACLAFAVLASGRYRARIGLRDPMVRQILHLLWPVVLGGILTRWTPVVDRYLASNLAAGAVSHLGYAFRLVTMLAMFVSAGVATVLFPRMALHAGDRDLDGLRETLSVGLRMMWCVVAPLMAVGAALAPAVISVVFERGAFGPADTLAVSGLLQVYLPYLAGATLGNLTSRTFYALRDTRTVAAVGLVEALAYVGYAPLLTGWFGARGVAMSSVVYFSASLAWQLLVLRGRLGGRGGARLSSSILRTGLAASAGACVAWLAIRSLPDPHIRVLVGASSGLCSYAGALWLMRSPELHALFAVVHRSRTPVVSDVSQANSNGSK